MADYHCTTREALRALFTARPNERIGAAHVYAVMDRKVSRTAISKTTISLNRSGEFVVISLIGPAGGYISCVIVDAPDPAGDRCLTCQRRIVAVADRQQTDRCSIASKPVHLRQWCAGHRERVTT